MWSICAACEAHKHQRGGDAWQARQAAGVPGKLALSTLSPTDWETSLVRLDDKPACTCQACCRSRLQSKSQAGRRQVAWSPWVPPPTSTPHHHLPPPHIRPDGLQRQPRCRVVGHHLLHLPHRGVAVPGGAGQGGVGRHWTEGGMDEHAQGMQCVDSNRAEAVHQGVQSRRRQQRRLLLRRTCTGASPETSAASWRGGPPPRLAGP